MNRNQVLFLIIVTQDNNQVWKNHDLVNKMDSIDFQV